MIRTRYMSNDPSTQASSSLKPSCLSVGSKDKISSAPTAPILAIKDCILGGLPMAESSCRTLDESFKALSVRRVGLDWAKTARDLINSSGGMISGCLPLSEGELASISSLNAFSAAECPRERRYSRTIRSAMFVGFEESWETFAGVVAEGDCEEAGGVAVDI